MHTTRVSIGAGRRFGMILTGMFLLTAAMPAAEITATITGTLNGGEDGLRLFRLGTAWNLSPFSLVFRFDDTKGQQGVTRCGSTFITGKGAASPATAVLTINGIAYEFGKGVNPAAEATRSVASLCSNSNLRFAVSEGPEWGRQGVKVVIRSAQGVRSLAQEPDWRSPISTTAMQEWSNESKFSIVETAGFNGSGGNFNIKQLVVVKK